MFAKKKQKTKKTLRFPFDSLREKRVPELSKDTDCILWAGDATVNFSCCGLLSEINVNLHVDFILPVNLSFVTPYYLKYLEIHAMFNTRLQ